MAGDNKKKGLKHHDGPEVIERNANIDCEVGGLRP